MEGRPRQYRLSRRAARPLLLHAIHAGPCGGRRALHGDHGRDLSPRSARRRPPAQRRAGRTHHHRCAHAEGPPGPSGVDALADPRLGPGDGPRDPRARGRDSQRSAASRAGLSVLYGPVSPRPPVREGAARGCLCAGTGGGGTLLPSSRCHPQARARSHAAAGADDPRPCPRHPARAPPRA